MITYMSFMTNKFLSNDTRWQAATIRQLSEVLLEQTDV